MTRAVVAAAAAVVVGLGWAALAALLGPPGDDRPASSLATGTPASSRGSEPTPAITPAVPETAYVSPDGDDRDDGTRDAPWRTPQRAADSGARRVVLLPGQHPGFEIARPGLVVTGRGAGESTIAGQVRIAADDVRVERISVTGADGPYEGGLLVDGVAGVTISRTRVHDNTFGIHLRDAEGATISDNEIVGNGAGVEIHGAATGTTISDNRIHHNDRAVDRSRGANAIVFFRAAGPVTVVRNELWSNVNPSPEPGSDAGGGAFEVYASTDVIIEENVIWDSSVLETGTEDGLTCRGLVFVRNVAWRGPSEAAQEGLVLRCAEDGLVAHNTFDSLDRFAVDVIHMAGAFGGSVEGLRIVNNIITFGRAYSIDNELPPSVLIDHNLVHNPASTSLHGEFLAYVAGRGNTRLADELRRWGLDRHGISSDPGFVARGARDYHLAAGSPAIDAGLPLPGVNDVADGRPDIGRWEAN